MMTRTTRAGAKVISDEAVEAAAKLIALEMGTPSSPTIYRHLARKALEAAAPHMLAAVFDEGVKAGADYQFKLAHAIEHGEAEDPAPIINPYRSQA